MKNFAAAGWATVLLAGCAGMRVALAQAAVAPSALPDAVAQQAGNAQASMAPHRTRLVLKDGSYQIVMSYTVKGKIVSYYSAERDETEEIPTDLVDWDATHKWERQNRPASGGAAGPEPTAAENSNPTIDPQLLQEEADRAAWTPEVAPDLHLSASDSVLALDTFNGTPELVPLEQSVGEMDHTASHNILKLSINPRAASHDIVQLNGAAAAVQLHVDRPTIYLCLGDDTDASHGGTPFTVDTHGANDASAAKTPSSGETQNTGYVMVRADVRTDVRVLASFNTGMLGGTQKQENAIETTSELLPGGHWMKVTPKTPLDAGEYALMEVVSANQINLGVWDFGVHPTAPENKDAIKPRPKRPLTLQRRAPE